MKNLTKQFWAKAVAVVLLVLLALTVLGCVIGFWLFSEYDAYLDDGVRLRRGVEEALAHRWSSEAERYYSEYAAAQEQHTALDPAWAERFSEKNSNFFFKVTDADGTEVLSSYDAEHRAHISYSFSDLTNADIKDETHTFKSAAERQVFIEELQKSNQILDLEDWENETGSSTEYGLFVSYSDTPQLQMDGYIRSDLKADDGIKTLLGLTDRLIEMRYAIFWIGGLALLGAVAVLIFLLRAAGRRETDDEIHLSWFDRIPLDLLIAAGLLSLAALFEATNGEEIVLAAAVLPYGLFGIALLMSMAVRAKTGTFWTNNVIWMAAKLVWRFVRWSFGALRDLLRSLPLFWRTLLVWGGICLVELFAVAATGAYDAPMLWLLEKLILTPLLFFAVIAMQRLQKGAKCLADGDLTHTVDLKHMWGPFRQHGEYLNSISDGLQTAVDERVKSERMKAELITNVSHDIKTPLTSIVNYVDLLKKEPSANERSAEYLEVLDRQSQRLKKLTEDLVEASKASTGNIAVHAERTDLNVLLEQAAGEFSDRFTDRRLETVRTTAPEQPHILADGQLLWRVFSNLLSNIYKYAMEGTRVYLSTAVQGGSAVVTFRNISGEALNVSGAELTERFVRGDRARSGEGSGLGLSIARSLTELMGGTFTVTVDGDLFKVELRFPVL